LQVEAPGAWEVEGHPHAHLPAALAMHMLVMVLVELLATVHRSRAAVHTALVRTI